ncbi:MAG: tRNA (adenosine(37)-N6)-threonylcarbamoyltransferase complex ATPase subunit type 1 TsaE, partial [bacterium]
MTNLNLITKNLNETLKFGERLARRLKRGDIVALTGNLGSGKTSLTQGIARGLGVKGYIRSPSFKLINEYKGNVPIFHFDLWRLKSIAEVEELGYRDYFYNNGVTVIEWAEKIGPILPQEYWQV